MHFLASGGQQPSLPGRGLFVPNRPRALRAQKQQVVWQSTLDSNRRLGFQPLQAEVTAGHQLIPPNCERYGSCLMIVRAQVSDIEGMI